MQNHVFEWTDTMANRLKDKFMKENVNFEKNDLIDNIRSRKLEPMPMDQSMGGQSIGFRNVIDNYDGLSSHKSIQSQSGSDIGGNNDIGNNFSNPDYEVQSNKSPREEEMLGSPIQKKKVERSNSIVQGGKRKMSFFGKQNKDKKR